MVDGLLRLVDRGAAHQAHRLHDAIDAMDVGFRQLAAVGIGGQASAGTQVAGLDEGLGFAIPVELVKSFLDHRDAFAYSTDNPNNPFRYLEPPSRTKAQVPEAK